MASRPVTVHLRSSVARQPCLGRHLSSTPARRATPLYMLTALSHARETQHFMKRSGHGVTNHVPGVEAIKRSEVDPFTTKQTQKPAASSTHSAPVLEQEEATARLRQMLTQAQDELSVADASRGKTSAYAALEADMQSRFNTTLKSVEASHARTSASRTEALTDRAVSHGSGKSTHAGTSRLSGGSGLPILMTALFAIPLYIAVDEVKQSRQAKADLEARIRVLEAMYTARPSEVDTSRYSSGSEVVAPDAAMPWTADSSKQNDKVVGFEQTLGANDATTTLSRPVISTSSVTPKAGWLNSLFWAQ